MQRASTLMACAIQVTATVEFQPTSLQPVPTPWPELAAIAEELARALEAPGRKVLVIGHAGNDEPTTPEARDALAGGRAEVVRSLLIGAGLPGDRLVLTTQERHVRSEPLPDHLRVVSFQLDPPDPTRTDASAQGRRGDLPWCD